MKKNLTIIFSVLMILLISNIAFASGDSIGITVNGDIKVIPKEMGQVFSMDSRTFVPLRFVSETLGFKVDWDAPTKTATVHSRDGEVKVSIGKANISTPSGVVEMDVAPFIKDTRTYVPVRFVAETLGFEVDWMNSSKIENSKDYSYVNYVIINGELGSEIETIKETEDTTEKEESTSSGVSNIVSDNPEDWPETENEFQYAYELAKNDELIEYLEANYNNRYHLAGYSISGPFKEKLNVSFAISKNAGGQLSTPVAVYGIDLREDRGYWDIEITEFPVVREGFEQILRGIAGAGDGQYIFDYYERGRNPNETEDLKPNTWLKTPSGREFQIVVEKGISGVGLLIK